MNIKLVGVFMLLCLVSIPGMQAQSFDELWKQVEQAEKNNLPRTLVDLTDSREEKGLSSNAESLYVADEIS